MNQATRTEHAHGIDLTVLRTRHALAAIVDEWAAIAAESGGAAGPLWHLPWLDVFGTGVDLRVLAAWRGGKLVAVLPLEKTDSGGVAGLEWLRNPHTPLFEPACRRDDLEVVCHALLEWACDRRSSWGRLVLGGIRQDHPMREAMIHAIDSTSSPAVIREAAPSRILETRLPFEELVKRRSKGFKNRLRVARAATRKRDIQVECIRTPDAFEAILPELNRASRESWQGQQGTGAFAAKSDRRFYTTVGRTAAERDVLRLHLCRIDGQVAGYLLELLGHGTSLMLKSEFDSQYGKLSVGWHLVKSAYELAHAEDARALDFGNWPTRFKDEWATHLLPHWNFHVFRRDWRGRAASSALRLVGTMHRCAAVVSAEADRVLKTHPNPSPTHT